MANLQHEDVDPNRAKMSTEMSTSRQSGPSDNVPRAIKEEANITSLIPTFAEACKLISTPYSCLVLDTHRRHVALPPMFLKKKKTGIEEELNAELLKYAENLKGVPLAYDNIKLLGQHGDIFNDQGYIHFNIEASFVVFKPKRGQKLEGLINKIGLTHVGCLVHGCFNASIPKPKEISAELWRDSGLATGGSLEFEVVQLDADAAGVLLIRGKLNKTWYEEKLKQTDPITNAAHVMPSDNTTLETTQEVDGIQPKKKKKKKDKSKDKEALDDSVVEDSQISVNVELSGTHGDLNSNGHVEKKKKKKKKDKHQEMEEVEAVTPTDLPGSDSSGYLSDKSNRKRKGSDETNGTGFRSDSEKPVAKKKKK
ncbi:hypothetical protein ACEWY4_024439 [Coilia grayii]|uniref:DNA-directed RNA polymerase subunit n=1 Tax=Coilia grayii TaxID=363190 RepID=A0ABD1J3G5_9TELE